MVSGQIASELSWILRHPAGVWELLGGVMCGETHSHIHWNHVWELKWSYTIIIAVYRIVIVIYISRKKRHHLSAHLFSIFSITNNAGGGILVHMSSLICESFSSLHSEVEWLFLMEYNFSIIRWFQITIQSSYTNLYPHHYNNYSFCFTIMVSDF